MKGGGKNYRQLFRQKKWRREGGSVRREVNSEAAKGDVEIMPV